MIIECPACGSKYKYDESKLEGASRKKVKCAKCKGVIEIVNPNKEPENEDMDQTYGSVPTSATVIQKETATKDAPKTTTKVKRDMLTRDDPNLKMPDSRKISLAVIQGNNSGEIFQIERPKMVIGRGDADIPIKDLEASRQHARIDVLGDRVVLRDLNSTNGTFVNEQKITVSNLENQSEFRIGTTVFMLIVTDVE